MSGSPDSSINDPQDDSIECPNGYHICGSDSTNCCLDPTSHNFVWEVDTLVGYGSVLRDVAIIDENNVWVVGNIDMDTIEYKAAHWNGYEWELMGIYINTLDLYNVHFFSEDDIWFTSHCFPLHWNGFEWTLYHLNDMGMDSVCAGAGNAIWGTSSSNLYFVGDNGSIVHYDGAEFERMESGTEFDLRDISGQNEVVFSMGTELFHSPSICLKLIDGQWSTLLESYDYTGDIENGDYDGYSQCVDVWQDTAYIVTAQGLLKFNYQTRESVLDDYLKDEMVWETFISIHVIDPQDIMLLGVRGTSCITMDNHG